MMISSSSQVVPLGGGGRFYALGCRAARPPAASAVPIDPTSDVGQALTNFCDRNFAPRAV